MDKIDSRTLPVDALNERRRRALKMTQGAFRRRFATLHRLTGRVFVLAGAGLALSGLALLLQVESIVTGLLDAAPGVFGLALITALVLAVAAARAHDMLRHRAWMIRAYATGMGTGAAALVEGTIPLDGLQVAGRQLFASSKKWPSNTGGGSRLSGRVVRVPTVRR